jgi:hypothetical protein
MVYMLAGNMDRGIDEFQIEAAIGKVLTSVGWSTRFLCFHKEWFQGIRNMGVRRVNTNPWWHGLYA